MTITEISLAVQDLSLEDAKKLVDFVKGLGGTANGKLAERDFETGDVTKKVFVLNNYFADKLFKEGTDNGHDDIPVSGSTPAQSVCCGGCGDDCSCDCNPVDPDDVFGDDIGYSYPGA